MELGICHSYFEGDSKIVVKALNQCNSSSSSTRHLVKDIQSIAGSLVSHSSHIRRHDNVVTHTLAKRVRIVRTYVIHLFGTYVTILYNWLIRWQNTLYLYLGRSRMCLILQETMFQDQVLKTCKSIQDSSWRSAVH